MAEQQESDQTAKRKSRSDIFPVIGILSIIGGFFTLLIPWIWGIPLTVAGLIIMRRKERSKEAESILKQERLFRYQQRNCLSLCRGRV